MPVVNVSSNQLICEKCGSTHFVEAEFCQYRRLYSSSPGSELSSVTDLPIRALVCMCGHPIPLGHLRKQSFSPALAGFQKSLESARRYRRAAEPQTILDRISPTLVNREEYAKLAEQIANLETITSCALPGFDSIARSTSARHAILTAGAMPGERGRAGPRHRR
jgi:hypothetical protein